MRILVTCFEPFHGDVENASGQAVRRLVDDWSDPEIDVVTATLPVAFGASAIVLERAVAERRPDAVLAVGEAGGRAAVTPERHGRNRMDARIPDEAGEQPRDEPIDDGPQLRPSAFDVDAMVAAITAAGVPASASDDAGGFVCNRVAVAVAGLDVPGGFVHVPAVRSNGTAIVGDETDAGAIATASALTFDDLARALAACVRIVAAGVR